MAELTVGLKVGWKDYSMAELKVLWLVGLKVGKKVESSVVLMVACLAD